MRTLWRVGLAVFSALFGMYLSENPSFRNYEESALDMFFKVQASAVQQKNADVVLVFVDEQSLAADYGYYDPIPRRYLAKLIDALAEKSPHTIGLDIALFDRFTKPDAGGDTLLAKTIKQAGNVIGVSNYYYLSPDSIIVQNPHSLFLEAFQDVGFATLPISSGGGGLSMVRGVKPVVQTVDGKLAISFSALLYTRFANMPADVFAKEVFHEKWQKAPFISMDNGTMIINFSGSPATWEKQPNGDWLQKKAGSFLTFRSSAITGNAQLPEALFKDKVVIIGNGSEFARDQFLTPFFGEISDYQMMRGSEVHANAFSNLLYNSSIRRLPGIWVFLIFLQLAYFMVLATARLEFWGELFTCLGLLLFIRLSGFLLFVLTDTWFPVVGGTVTVLMAFFTMAIYMALTERKTRRQLKEMFQRYAPESYVDELIKDPSKLELGGEEKEISMIFCDIKGFSAISESLPPKELVKLLNDYFDVMTKAVFKCGGTLDKYIGDAILSVFGAPIAHPKHALQACSAALEMQRTLARIAPEWEAKGHPKIKVRIGVNTGTVVFGNIGSEIHYDYTGIGDAMNLTSRLESVNTQYKTGILISEYTYEQAKENLLVRYIDTIIVKGKSVPVKVYELLGEKGESLHADFAEMLVHYNLGIHDYSAQNWSAAAAAFNLALQSCPDDYPSQMYLERCHRFSEKPPEENWDGVFRLTEK